MRYTYYMDVRKIFVAAKQMDNYVFALALKCEICGPQLRGVVGRYPECPKHDISYYIGPRD